MKLEKRAQSASEETAAQIPAAPAAENGRHKPVLLYLVILFAIAFVLILFSFIMHQRSNAEVLKELQSQVETLQELQQDDLYLALPNETDEGEMYETPRAAYDRILEALSNTAG